MAPPSLTTASVHAPTPLRTLAHLSPLEGRLLAVALPLVAAVRIALWVLPSRTLVRAVRRLAESRERVHAHRPPAATVVWAVTAAARRVPRATCLTQAVASQLLFRHYGHEARLVLGVAPTPAGVRAHAWVEHAGRVVIGGEESHALVRLPDFGVEEHEATAAGRRTAARRETPQLRPRR